MSDINWGLLTSANAPLANPIDALRAGAADRDAAQLTALKQQQFAAQQAAAQRAQAAQQQAGAAYATGNVRGANAALIGSGQNDLLSTVNTTTKQDFDQHQAGQKAIADMAGYIQEHIPADQRAAFITHLDPWFQAAGASPSDIATVASNPTNETLGAISRAFYSTQEQDAARVAQQNADSTTQNVGINQQNADTTRMGEIRQENTPVGISINDNVYVPGGVTPSAPGHGSTFDRMIGAESSGHQLNAQGQPLTSSKGAVGIAQMLPSTAQDAARMMGVQFDPQRFATDANYNRQLGQTYFTFLVNRYHGDETKAAAAYNGGLGRVDAAVAQNGQNWLSAMPHETRAYVAKVQPGQAVRGPTMIAAGVPKENPNPVDPADPAIEMAARQYAATGEMPALGNGQGPMRHAILTRAAQIVQTNHWTPAQIAANKATVKSATTALSADNRMYDTIQTAEETALANGQRYLDLAAKMPGNTSSTWYNRVRNGLGAEFSDQRVTDANTAYQTFVSEYNRVINSTPSGSGTLTDASRREAQETFNNATNSAAKVSAFNVMKADMAARKAAQQHIIDRRTAIIANVGQTGPTNAGPARIASAAEYHALPSGTVYIDPTGHQRRKP